MPEAVIVATARTPIGRAFKGSLKDVRPDDLATTIVRASGLPHSGDNTDRLIQLTMAVGGDEHITSTWGTDRKYIEWDRVSAAGITIRTQEFVHPSYQQQFDPFEPNLGVLDLIFSQGPAAATSISRSSTFPRVTD